MSEVIPEYIGSRLSVMEDDSMDQPLSETTNEVDTIESDPPKPVFKVEAKKKKTNGMIKKGIKKKKSGTKKLPLNPNAVQATPETPATDPINSEIDQPTSEAASEEATEKVSIVAGLKKNPSRKKKLSRPASKKKIKKEPTSIQAAPIITTEAEEQPVETAKLPPEEVVKPTPPVAKTTKKVLKTKQPELKQKIATPSPAITKSASSRTDAEERKAFVQNLKKETNDYLKRLAEERKQRQLEYEAFRQKLRSDLAKK